MKKTLGIIVAAILLSGCATTAQQSMSPEQLKALAADKNFSAVCSTVTGIHGTGKFVYVNVDRSVVNNGEIHVDNNCLVTMTNTRPGTVPPPPAVPVIVTPTRTAP